LSKPIYSPELRAKVALTALLDDKQTAELCEKFNVDSTQVDEWVIQLFDGAPGIFAALDAKKTVTKSTIGKAIRDLIRQN
jgi:transposase-like protein